MNKINDKEYIQVKAVTPLNALYKIVDKLEQRIAKLEKVLASHAKCIGELRGTELRIHDLSELTPEEFAKQVKFK